MLALVPTLPQSIHLERFHNNATESPLYTIVTWTTQDATKNGSIVMRKRQLAIEPITSQLLELQRVGATTDKNRSWFIGNRVQQDGSIVMFTPMDPLFVLLHAVSNADKFMSIYDLVSIHDNGWWLQLTSSLTLAQIEMICDIQCMGEETLENLLVRGNERKIIEWLVPKVRRVADVLATQATQTGTKQAFDERFVAPVQQSNKENEHAQDSKVYYNDAIDIIANYLPNTKLIQLLRAELRVTPVAPIKVSSDTNFAAGECTRRFDRRMTTPDPITPSTKRNAPPSSSSKKKSKLANVDRTGMKTLASFFGKK